MESTATSPEKQGGASVSELQRFRWRLVCIAIGLFAAGPQVRPAHGGILYVGDQKPTSGGVNGNQVLRFNDTTGALITTAPNPFQSGYSVEGIDALKIVSTGATQIFIGDFTNGTIHVVDAATGNLLKTFTTGSGQASLRLSHDGNIIYATAETLNGGTTFALRSSDGSVIKSTTAVAGAHDVVVLGDGSVLLAAYAQHSNVFHYTANLNLIGTFITNGDHGLGAPTGMIVDHAGNVWIADFTDSLVSKYDKNGNFLGQVVNSTTGAQANWLFHPIGIDVGPDGNIYVPVYGSNQITMINNSTLALTNFVASPTPGNGPKYLRFDVNAVTLTPLLPEPSSLVLASMGVLVLGTFLRRPGRKLRRQVSLQETQIVTGT
jgi:hypothetical protein